MGRNRMLCTECFGTAEPDTLLEGSDFVEMLGWCALAVPGWLYCAWRHAARRKLCAFCGGGELVREARAIRGRRAPQAPPSHGPRVLSGPSPARWPRGLSTPRERLRQGGVGAILVSGVLLSWLLAALGTADPRVAGATLLATTLLCASWMLHQIARVTRLRRGTAACQAWDEHGRSIRIELI